MNHKTKEFKKLQKEWYKKLAKEGFEDIEQDEEHLKQWESGYFLHRYSPDVFAAKQEYFRLAGRFLLEHDFESAFERKVWALYAEGHTLSFIRKRVKSKNKGIMHIHKTVKKLEAEMLNKCR